MKLAYTVASILVAHLCTAAEVSFDDIVKDPARYNLQRVTVKGILEVYGDDNELWRDTSARRRIDLNRCIHVWVDLKRPPYPGTNMSPDSPANLHWVKVTGIVDTSMHGRFGNERFGLFEEKIQILPGPRLKQFLAVKAWFMNESGHKVIVNVKTKNQGTEFTLDRNTLDSAVIEGSKSTATITDSNGSLYTKALLTPPGSKVYYDAERRYYYYRIKKHRIEPVTPREARHWHFYPTPDRD